MNRLIKLALVIAALCIGVSIPVAAEASLELRPLQYVETLQKGERKQGMIDIHNPQPYDVDVRLSVQGFRQIDHQGNLEFFESEQLRDGITLDIDSAKIPAHKTLRLFFTADSTKLPTGDVFAAVFAEAMPTDHQGASTTVRLGSLLILTNQTPGARQAVVDRLSMNWLQIGDGLRGEAVIKNTAPPKTAGGFFPPLQLTTWPFGPSVNTTGPLVQSGNERTVQLKQPTNLFGIYRVRIATGSSHQDRWIVAVTGYWRWLSVVVLLGVAGGLIALKRWRQHNKLVKK